jgi:hypothetical protein
MFVSESSGSHARCRCCCYAYTSLQSCSGSGNGVQCPTAAGPSLASLTHTKYTDGCDCFSVCCVGAKFSSVVLSSRRSVAPGARLPGARSTISLASRTPIYGLPIPTTSVRLSIPTSSRHEENSPTRPVCCTLCIHLGCTRPGRQSELAAAACVFRCKSYSALFLLMHVLANGLSSIPSLSLASWPPLSATVALRPKIAIHSGSMLTRAIFNQLHLRGPSLGVLLLLSVLRSARQLPWLRASREDGAPRISILLLSSPSARIVLDSARSPLLVRLRRCRRSRPRCCKPLFVWLRCCWSLP